MRTILTSLILLALATFASPVRADDTTPPQLSHTPVTSAPSGQVTIAVDIKSERKFFPQLFTRSPGGAWKAPIDLKKGKSGKWEATITLHNDPIEYYIECYDEVGNGPARVADPDHPIVLEPARAAPPPPPPTVAAAPPPPKHETPPPPPKREDRSMSSNDSVRPSAPVEAVYSDPNHPGINISQGTATWHSALLPGWGQLGSDRKIRGVAFAGLVGAGVIASIWTAARAAQADNVYNNSSEATRVVAYNQAQSYSNARNWVIGLTAAVWVVNIAEAYLGYGSHD